MLFTSYRYIVKELLVPFIMGIMVFTFILIMFQVLRLTEFIVVHGVEFIIILKMFYYLVVAFFPITIPVSFLFSVLLTFSRFSSDNEIIAFKASGISVYQLMIPVMAVSLIAGILTFYVSFYEGPWGNRSFENTLHKIGSSRATMQLKEGFFNERFLENFIIYAGKIDSERDIMEKVFIYDNRDRDMPVVITAKSARLEIDDVTKKTLLFLYDGFMNFIQNTGEKYRRASFDNYRILLYKGKAVGDKAPAPPSMSYKEIQEQIKDAESRGDLSWNNKMHVELHRRYAIPFACLIFGLLGVAFGNTSNRNVKTGAGVFSFVVMLLYWIIYVSGTSLGSRGTIHPVLSVWIANILFFIIAVYLLRKRT